MKISTRCTSPQYVCGNEKIKLIGGIDGYFPDFAPFDFFDGIVVSADLHMVKPDIRIYQSLLEKFHLLSEECLFIDDLEENVEGAKQAGMSGEIFRGDFDRIKKQYLEGRRIWD